MIKAKSVARNNACERNRWFFFFGAKLDCYYKTFLASHSCTFYSLFSKKTSASLNTQLQKHKYTNTSTLNSNLTFQQYSHSSNTTVLDRNIDASFVSMTSREIIQMLMKKISASLIYFSWSCREIPPDGRAGRHLLRIDEENYFQLKCATQQKPHACTKAGYKKNIFNDLTQLSFTIVLLLFLISSCKKPDISFGSQFLNNSNTQVVYVDTVTTEITTVYIDSFKTSGIDGSVAGIYSDPYFGTAKAKSYLQVAPPSYKDSFSNAIFDSLELLLHLNKTFYGDTLKPLTLQVFRLAQNIKPTSGASYIFSNDSFAVYESPLAQKTFTLRPNGSDSIIHIHLHDELGVEWLNMLASSADAMKSSDAFINYFKGFCIAPAGQSAFVFGFTDSVIARLHYKTKGIFLTAKQVDFSLYNKDYQFENISVDRTGTALSNISATNNEINTSLTSSVGYLQGTTGTVIKFRFPYLRSMLQTAGYVQLMSAQLKVKPVNGTFGGIYPLPPKLILSSTDASNKIGTAISDASGNIQTGALQIDELYGNTYYSYDITSYLKSIISISTNNSYGLIISPASPQFETTFNRVLIGDNKNKTSQTQLILYYLAVQ